MPLIGLELGWREIAVRVGLTFLASTLFGLNRETHGGAAGLRTTILVGLAASAAMIQANLLLSTTGRPADSFVTLDVMRLPLGILSGVGFLGAGVLFRRRDLVTGVTTAAILWITTVIGLCFGGGQLGLGVAATLLGVGTLWGLRYVERYIPRDVHAALVVTTSPSGPTRDMIVRLLDDAGLRIVGEALRIRNTTSETQYDVRWRGRRDTPMPSSFVALLAKLEGVEDVRWRPQGLDQA